MNWCQPHWALLRKAVEDRGMSHLGAQSGQEAAKELASQIEGEEETFDPLLGSWSRINNAMADSLTKLGRGHEILQFKCPLCILVEDGQPQTVANWVDGCTDQAKQYAISKGLIKANG